MHASSVFFVSDAHLGVDGEDREAARTSRLHEFLNSLPGRASSLYIVGDLFDFWFEYRTAIPRRHFATLAVLARLRDAGVEIAYLNGNHDFWLGTFFRDTLGIRTIDGGVGIPLAHTVSRWSRHSRGEAPLEPERLWREIALPRFAEGFDGVLIGHFHHAYERRENGREFFVLGDWIDRFTYAELCDGRIDLKTWPA